MDKSARPAEKRANFENKAQSEPKAKKNRSNNRTSNIATLDNGTMVETFKYLNYCQLAKNSLVSKRFRDVIQTHRHKLALLYVHSIYMDSFVIGPACIKIFDKELSPEAYNDWVIRNNYSKQAPFEDQVANIQSTQDISNGYLLSAFAHYEDPNHRESKDITTVFFSHVELNHENWPAFQHFVHLATDPFIYIDYMELTPQNDVLNMLSGAIESDRRLEYQKLVFQLRGISQEFLTWTKNNVRCNQFCIESDYSDYDVTHDEALIDFVLTGACCTSAIEVDCYDLYKVIVYFVEKFLDLEYWDEYQGVQSIKGFQLFKEEDVQILKNEYSTYIVKEEHNEAYDCSTYVFEFTNYDVGRKLQFTVIDNCHDSDTPVYSLKIKKFKSGPADASKTQPLQQATAVIRRRGGDVRGNSQEIRNKLTEYIRGAGAVGWQDEYL
ncbi:hypothetical protein Ddc_17857 [Ditylenchus destructor]|nr:hypothetical protein Ddc_17857 [Ditylenchus destructor]